MFKDKFRTLMNLHGTKKTAPLKVQFLFSQINANYLILTLLVATPSLVVKRNIYRPAGNSETFTE